MARVRLGTALMLTLAACTDSCGGGCTGCVADGYEFGQGGDPSLIQENQDAAAFQITQSFLDFVAPRIPILLKEALRQPTSDVRIDRYGVLRLRIPNQRLFNIGVANAHLRDAEAFLWLDDIEKNLRLSIEAPGTIAVELRALRLGLNFKVKEFAAGADASCPVRGDLGPDGPGPERHAARVDLRAKITARIGDAPVFALDPSVQVDDAIVSAFDLDVRPSRIYCREPECEDCLVEVFGNCVDPVGRCGECRALCGGLTEGLFSLASVLSGIVRPRLNDLLRSTLSEVLEDLTAPLRGTPARAAGQWDPAGLLPGASRGRPVGFQVAAHPGPLSAATGPGTAVLAAPVSMAFEATPAPCVRTPPAKWPAAGPAPTLLGLSGDGRPYHVALRASEAALNQGLAALFQSGAFCIELDTERIRALTDGNFQLTTEALSLLSPALRKVAPPNAPAHISVRAKTQPVLSLNDPADDTDTPLFDLSIERVAVSLYLFVEDRFVRVMEVDAQASIALDVDVFDEHVLRLTLGELRVSDFDQVFNELVPQSDFALLLPAFIDLAVGAVLGDGIRFDANLTRALSSALGIPLGLEILSIERRGDAEDHLVITGAFHPALDAPQPIVLGPPRIAAIQHGAPGSVTLDLPEHTFDRIIARVDGGPWREASQTSDAIVVQDPRLLFPGPHRLQLRPSTRTRTGVRGAQRTETIVEHQTTRNLRLYVVRAHRGTLFLLRSSSPNDSKVLHLEVNFHGASFHQMITVPVAEGTGSHFIPGPHGGGTARALLSGDASESLTFDPVRRRDDVIPSTQAPGCHHKTPPATESRLATLPLLLFTLFAAHLLRVSMRFQPHAQRGSRRDS